MSAFYDQMARFYYLIFPDWDQSIERQAGQLAGIIRERWKRHKSGIRGRIYFSGRVCALHQPREIQINHLRPMAPEFASTARGGLGDRRSKRLIFRAHRRW